MLIVKLLVFHHCNASWAVIFKSINAVFNVNEYDDVVNRNKIFPSTTSINFTVYFFCEKDFSFFIITDVIILHG